jgi:hypothetical protein
MTSLLDDARRMVPRWRPAGQTLAHGEFAPLALETRALWTGPDELLRSVTADWLKRPQFGFAADLVGVASILRLGELPDAVRNAAEFILSNTADGDPRAIRRVAAELVGRGDGMTSSDRAHQPTTLRLRLRGLRAETRNYEFDPLKWVDLARLHASLGNRSHAERAMRVAMGLAPQHRFVLRSFTRLALHLGNDKDLTLPIEAWTRLQRALKNTNDPWLIAAEIATAMVIGRTPRSVKAARGLLTSARHSPFELSEMAGRRGEDWETLADSIAD